MRIQLIWAGAPNIKSTSMNLAWQRENFANGVILRFMDLSYEEVSYFIQQVGLSAASFGVATDDVQAVGMALGKAFNYRCAPPMTVVPSQGMQLQSICQQADCPLSPNATCAAYGNSTQPSIAVSSLVPTNTASGTATPLASASKTWHWRYYYWHIPCHRLKSSCGWCWHELSCHCRRCNCYVSLSGGRAVFVSLPLTESYG
jgi:hypothetical protein